MRKNLKGYTTLIVIILFYSCNKDVSNDLKIEVTSLSNSVLRPTAVTVPTFDWEHDDTLPTPSGQPKILSPFAIGTNQQFPTSYIEDKNKADGWNLLYSTFSKENIEGPKFFMLYNRFTGILRGFFYISPNNVLSPPIM